MAACAGDGFRLVLPSAIQAAPTAATDSFFTTVEVVIVDSSKKDEHWVVESPFFGSKISKSSRFHQSVVANPPINLVDETLCLSGKRTRFQIVLPTADLNQWRSINAAQSTVKGDGTVKITTPASGNFAFT
jgi:hypothetical protein